MISAANIREYINFLHMKKYSAPANEELKNRWAAVPEAELPVQLQGLYQHWGVDRATASLYEQLFLQSQYLYTTPAQQTAQTPATPISQPAQPQPAYIPPPRKSNTALLIGVIGGIVILALTGSYVCI